MEDLQEVPVVAAVGKGLAVAGKAVAKGVAAMAKAGAKAGAGAAKTAKATGSAAKGAAKGTAKAVKPAAKPTPKATRFKRPNIKSYKNKETGQVDIDRYRQDQAKYRKIKQDQKNRPDMSDTKPDGPGDARTKRGERKLKAIDKITQRKKANLKKGMQDAGDIAKKTADKAGEYGKKSVSATTKGFGTTSFTKEAITFKDYLNKL
tara:strand:+ start:759 stop:1373 length:615 start_codon:yes stop_codon:yes gene_type:complete